MTKVPFAVPPLNEQRRIVAKLEALQARSRRAREALDAVPPLLEKLRQSILAAAFRGDLTKEWRAKHPDVEPATELLKRVRIERRKKWEEAELAKLKAKGKAPTDDRWKAKYKEPERAEPSELPKLPNNWCWASLAELAWDSSYGTSTKCAVDADGVPVLRIPNVSGDSIDVSDMKYATTNLGMSPPELLKDGDLLLIRTNGSRDLIGRGALVDGAGAGCYFASYLIRFRLVTLGALPSFAAFALRAPSIRAGIIAEAATTAGQYNIGMSRLLSLMLPLPPLAEMRQLLQLGISKIGAIDAVGSAVVELLKKVTTLEASNLSKAFRGELVPQDPNDEPADVMLARLRAAAPTPEPGKRRRRGSEAAE